MNVSDEESGRANVEKIQMKEEGICFVSLRVSFAFFV